MKKYYFFLIFIISQAINCSAVTYYVNPGQLIQSAINIASSVNIDTIIVSPGTYVENIYIDRDLILTSVDPNDPDIIASTIIDGSANGLVVEFSGNETSKCILTGFTITNGYSGGICGGFGETPTNAAISNCLITNNYADYGGGLFRCNGPITNCTVSRNSAFYGGGLSECGGIISGCTISGNFARYGAGLENCSGSITNCVISQNDAVGFQSYGGGLAQCNGTISNCSIIKNTAEVSGGGLRNCNGTITNCIIWSNSAPDGYDLYDCSVPSYSCYLAGSGSNINSNPLFANADDYHLKSEAGRWNPLSQIWVYDAVTSPCIDTGDPNSNWQNELWPNGQRINMGAYGRTIQASLSLNTIGSAADFNLDDTVDWIDFAQFIADWLKNEIFLRTDMNHDNYVNIADFAIFAENFEPPQVE